MRRGSAALSSLLFPALHVKSKFHKSRSHCESLILIIDNYTNRQQGHTIPNSAGRPPCCLLSENKLFPHGIAAFLQLIDETYNGIISHINWRSDFFISPSARTHNISPDVPIKMGIINIAARGHFPLCGYYLLHPIVARATELIFCGDILAHES